MNCTEAQALLSLSQPPEPADAAVLAEHIAGCEVCRAVAASEAHLRGALATETTLQPSRRLQQALLSIPTTEQRRRALVPLLLPLAALVCTLSSALLWVALPTQPAPGIAHAPAMTAWPTPYVAPATTTPSGSGLGEPTAMSPSSPTSAARLTVAPAPTLRHTRLSAVAMLPAATLELGQAPGPSRDATSAPGSSNPAATPAPPTRGPFDAVSTSAPDTATPGATDDPTKRGSQPAPTTTTPPMPSAPPSAPVVGTPTMAPGITTSPPPTPSGGTVAPPPPPIASPAPPTSTGTATATPTATVTPIGSPTATPQ